MPSHVGADRRGAQLIPISGPSPRRSAVLRRAVSFPDVWSALLPPRFPRHAHRRGQPSPEIRQEDRGEPLLILVALIFWAGYGYTRALLAVPLLIISNRGRAAGTPDIAVSFSRTGRDPCREDDEKADQDVDKALTVRGV